MLKDFSKRTAELRKSFLRAAITCVLSMLVCTSASIERPSAQTSAGPAGSRGSLTLSDAVLLRDLSRYSPKMAKKIAAELRSTYWPMVRRQILNKYAAQLAHDGTTYAKFPEEVRDLNFFAKWKVAHRALSGMRGLWPHDQEIKYVESIRGRQNFEDQLVREVGFKDYHELYDFLGKCYPQDLGRRFLNELQGLRRHGKRKIYDMRVDFLAKELDRFRGIVPPDTPVRPSDSILNEIAPPSPIEKAVKPGPPKNPQKAGVCHQICDSPLQTAFGRGWCRAHCKDDVKP